MALQRRCDRTGVGVSCFNHTRQPQGTRQDTHKIYVPDFECRHATQLYLNLINPGCTSIEDALPISIIIQKLLLQFILSGSTYSYCTGL